MAPWASATDPGEVRSRHGAAELKNTAVCRPAVVRDHVGITLPDMTWRSRLMTAVALSAVVLWINLSWRPGASLIAPLIQRLAVATFLSSIFSLVHPGTITTKALVTDIRRRPRFWFVAASVFVAYLGSAYLPDMFRRWRLPVTRSMATQPNA